MPNATLRVMTLNLLCEEAVTPAGPWPDRARVVVHLLRSEEPDLVGVQEASRRQLSDLSDALPHYQVVEGPESGPERLPRLLRSRVEQAGEHCAILFRAERFRLVDQGAFWLSNRPDEPGSVLPGTWLPRVVNWARLQDSDNCDLTLYNAHFDFLPWAPTRSARILRNRMDGAWTGSLQIVTGDFNTTRYSAAFQHRSDEKNPAAQPPLLDAWMEAETRHGPARTYHGGTGRERWQGRLDRILFRPELRVERAVTLVLDAGGVYPSDHFPVVAELALPPDNNTPNCGCG